MGPWKSLRRSNRTMFFVLVIPLLIALVGVLTWYERAPNGPRAATTTTTAINNKTIASRNDTTTTRTFPGDDNEFPKEHDTLLWNNNETTTTTSSYTIVCQLSGEMANNLCHLAHCYAISHWLKHQWNVSTTIRLKHQERDKWIRAKDAVQQCFPAFRSLDFDSVTTPELEQQTKIQNEWLGIATTTTTNRSNLFHDINSLDPRQVESVLNEFVHQTTRAPQDGNTTATTTTTTSSSNSRKITVPFLHSTHMVAYGFYVDHYLDYFRNLFRFDESCCKEKPAPDESVLHFRNFIHELRRRAERLGYLELDPHRIAQELLGHLQPGDKVAMVTRFDVAAAEPYLQAFRDRGLQARLIRNQTDVEDFCFLKNAQKEMIGPMMSTYFLWASLLSNSSRVTAYLVNSTDRPLPFGATYRWKRPELRDKIHVRVFFAR